SKKTSKVAKKTATAKRASKLVVAGSNAAPKQTAAQFKAKLQSYWTSKKRGYLGADKEGYDPGDLFMGVGMGKVFSVAKEVMAMPLSEIVVLLKSPVHEIRVGAVAIMDFQARNKKTAESTRKGLF